MDIPAVLFCFLEVALKPRPTTTEAELISTQLKTQVAVHTSG